MHVFSAYPRPAALDPTASGLLSRGPCSPKAASLPKALSVSSSAILHVTASPQNLEHELRVHSSPHALLEWPYLFAKVALNTNVSKDLFLTFWGRTAGPLCAQSTSPQGSLTGFIAREGNPAAFEGFEGTSSYFCRLLSYLSFKTPCKGNHLRSCAVYFTYINSLHDHNSEVESGVPALTPSISPGKMSRSAESQAMNNMTYRRREGEGQLLETSGPL